MVLLCDGSRDKAFSCEDDDRLLSGRADLIFFALTIELSRDKLSNVSIHLPCYGIWPSSLLSQSMISGCISIRSIESQMDLLGVISSQWIYCSLVISICLAIATPGTILFHEISVS